MAGWEKSRHPEWEMMYAAGLTVREIADRCHHQRNTVHRHLQVREHYQPGLRATHEAALAARNPERPSSRWRRRHQEAQDFLATHGRLPHHNGDTVEKSLHTWISEQRRAYHRGKLSPPKIALLSSLPGWDAPTRQQELDQHWHTRLTQLKDYTATTGQLPRYKNHQTAHEHALGIWLHTQHQKRSNNTLQPRRLQALNAALPGWRSRT